MWGRREDWIKDTTNGDIDRPITHLQVALILADATGMGRGSSYCKLAICAGLN